MTIHEPFHYVFPIQCHRPHDNRIGSKRERQWDIKRFLRIKLKGWMTGGIKKLALNESESLLPFGASCLNIVKFTSLFFTATSCCCCCCWYDNQKSLRDCAQIIMTRTLVPCSLIPIDFHSQTIFFCCRPVHSHVYTREKKEKEKRRRL